MGNICFFFSVFFTLFLFFWSADPDGRSGRSLTLFLACLMTMTMSQYDQPPTATGGKRVYGTHLLARAQSANP